MICLRRFTGEAVYINAALIESVEQTPDTVVTLVSGNRLTVQETPEEIAILVRALHAVLPAVSQR